MQISQGSCTNYIFGVHPFQLVSGSFVLSCFYFVFAFYVVVIMHMCIYFVYIILCTLFCPVPGYPKVACEMIECPAPYMGQDALQPNAPPDKSLPAQDPFGTGNIYFVLLLMYVFRFLCLWCFVDVVLFHV